MSQFLIPDGIKKIVNDPIHGHFNLYPYCLQCIDTPQFQRLRDLKQLGSSYLVFPGGSHNRFEHSLGVSHLAGVWVERLSSNQPELGVSGRDIRLVRLAGLLHDLGHGCYSHVWDKHFVPQVARRKPHLKDWSHEMMSQRMFEYLVDVNNLDFEKEDIRIVNDLILPPSTGGHTVSSGIRRTDELFNAPGSCCSSNNFLYDIVNNRKTSVDVDKFDYLERDCYNLGLKSSYDWNRLLNFSRVIDNEICFYAKECYNLYELFHTRYSLFRQIYLHRVAQAIEYMVTDALLAADSYMKLSDACDKPERYTYLTDHILRTIEASYESELHEARSILKRIRTRHLYKFIDEFIVDPDDPFASKLRALTASDFVTHQRSSDVTLDPEDIIICTFPLNYAMKERNPVENQRFYNSADPYTSFTIDRKQVSHFIPSRFQEFIVRVFVRDVDKSDAAKNCFDNYFAKLSSSSSQHSLPSTLVRVSSPLRSRKRSKINEESATA